MTISAKIIEDSISVEGKRLTTLQLMYPRFIHAELMTHRDFSRNASSSRAIPVKKMIEMIRNEPAMPIHWGQNQAGMQAAAELSEGYKHAAQVRWREAAINAARVAEQMMELGLHKQVANRILEPFQHIHVVVSATEWDNFFALRAHPDAQPEIQALAYEMLHAFKNSVPTELRTGEWHLPYVTKDERNDQFFKLPDNRNLLTKISAARCCRVSYLKHDGSAASIADDLDLCDKLAGAVPIHASPFEHQATPDHIVADESNPLPRYLQSHLHGNFKGWIQQRKLIERSFSGKKV